MAMNLFSGDTALQKVNNIDNQFSRTFISDKLQYEADPLVTGFFFTSYKLPQKIFTGSEQAGRGSIDVQSGSNLLAATCTKITLPTIDIDPVVIEGMGGTWVQVPGKMNIQKEVSCSNIETTNAEVTAVLKQWAFTIRDPRTGSARVGNADGPQGANSNYMQKNYKGSMFYVLTDPNIDRVIFAIEFMGIWVKNVPLNSIANDVAANDKVEFDVTFPYDRLFMFPSNANYAFNEVLAKRFQIMMDLESKSGEGS